MNFSLKQLLEKYDIEIPILQRDYAQGRESKINVAKSFLYNIFDVLEENQNKLHIDFIYGYEENNKFILIDGQQRVTTLWIIYFIIYKMNDNFDDIKEILSNFSYSVRESSQYFCESLIEENLELKDRKHSPKHKITSSIGTFGTTSDLENDPTIKAMLNMMDLIYDKVKDKDSQTLERYINNLNNITFSIFNMGEYNLGEELYIKMNARGRQLSIYENIKAYIEKDIDLKIYYKLLSNIDNKWSDYFFVINTIDKFDNRGLSFLYYSSLFFHFKEKTDLYNNYENYLVDDLNEKVLEYNYFDILKNNISNIEILDNTITILLEKNDNKVINNFFNIFSNKKMDNKEICYFFALLSFAYKIDDINDLIKLDFDNYYRVCRHLIENYRIDKPSYIKNFFDLFESISDGYKNIYEYLINDQKMITFHKEMYKLEQRKAKLILDGRKSGDDWESVLNKTSDGNFLVGWIDFLLDFSNDNFEYFNKYLSLTIEIIDKINDLNFLNLFQSALLVFKDYGFSMTHLYYGNIPKINIFRDREAWNWIFSGKKHKSDEYYKKLLDKILKLDNKLSLEEKLKYIIVNANLKNKEWYEYLLIKESGLFRFITESNRDAQQSGKIKRSNNYIFILHTVKANKKYIDILSYSFYLYCSNNAIEVSDIHYETNKDMKSPYFDIIHKNKNLSVICDSVNYNIKIAGKKYNIDLSKGADVFSEFDRILKEAKLIK